MNAEHLEAENERLRAALTEIAATHGRNRWHPQTHFPSESAKRWHDGYISCAASHSIIAERALDPDKAAEDERTWAAASGSDAEWYAETGHCGHCGIVASACDCDGTCGCWEAHGPPLKPWGGVLADAEERGAAKVRERVGDLLADWSDFEHDAVTCPKFDCGDCTMLNAIHDLRAALTTTEADR